LIGIDNVLAKVADPSFVAFSQNQQKSIAFKYVRKLNPEEKVGVVVLKNSKPYIIGFLYISEYSELA